MQIDNDIKYINLAINLATKNLGNTKENPSIGCVIVKDGIILSTGITSKNGRPHAEINAINKIVDKSILSKATIYISLEPCSHFGKSPPCVDEIIKHKFSRVVICMIDPDLRVNGNGVKKLENAGIKTEIGLMDKEAYQINKDFFYGKKFNKPYVLLKIASSLDGKVSLKNHQSKWISSEESRYFTNNLRSKYDAIMVGANTIKNDNPTLDCRIEGLKDYSPIPIIISRKLEFTFEENIFKQDREKILICPANKKNNIKLNEWLKKSGNNKIIFIEEKNINNDLIDLNLALNKLYNFNIKSILVEGGSFLATELLKNNLINEIIWIHAPIILGNDSKSSIENLNIEEFNEKIRNFKLKSSKTIKDDIISTYVNKNLEQ